MMRSGVATVGFISIPRLIVTASPRRICSSRACKRRDLGTLLLYSRGKLSGRADTQDRSKAGEPCSNRGIDSDGADIRSDAVFEIDRHVPPSIETDQAVERELGIPRFLGGWNFWRQ